MELKKGQILIVSTNDEEDEALIFLVVEDCEITPTRFTQYYDWHGFPSSSAIRFCEDDLRKVEHTGCIKRVEPRYIGIL